MLRIYQRIANSPSFTHPLPVIYSCYIIIIFVFFFFNLKVGIKYGGWQKPAAKTNDLSIPEENQIINLIQSVQVSWKGAHFWVLKSAGWTRSTVAGRVRIIDFILLRVKPHFTECVQWAKPRSNNWNHILSRMRNRYSIQSSELMYPDVQRWEQKAVFPEHDNN